LSDNAANIYAGQNPDGSQRYIRLGKAWREPFGWMMAPLETLGSKLSMPLRQLLVQFTKSEPGGYPVINSKFTPQQQMEQRAGQAVEMFTPFSARSILQRLERFADPQVFKEQAGSSQIAGLPSRKVANFFQAVEDLREALAANRMDMAQQVLRNASLNKISPGSVTRELRSRLRGQMRTEVGLPKTEPPPMPPE
jgi:hypothetical protein